MGIMSITNNSIGTSAVRQRVIGISSNPEHDHVFDEGSI